MGGNSPAHKICDGCTRPMAKAAILHEGKAYCLRCFKKNFWPIPCEVCGNLTKSWHGQQPATCKVCRSKGRTCMDCGEPIVGKGEKGRKIGMTLPDGVVCSACRDQRREERPCAACGRPSKYLARDLKVGFTEPVCSGCRKKARVHIVCAKCGSYRYEFGVLDGKKVCFTCYRQEVPADGCPVCGAAGTQGALCAECRWKEYVRKVARETAAGFSHEWCKGLVVEFCDMLIGKYGGYDSTLVLPLHLPFFATLDREFAERNLVTVEALCCLYPDNELRKYDVPFHFLEANGVIAKGRKARGDAYQALKQQGVVARARDQWYGATLKGFLEHMLKVRERYQKRGWVDEHERFKMLSITKSVECAELFLRTADVHDTRQLTPDHLDMFFLEHKAYKHSLFAFVRFLRKRGRTFLKLDMRGLPKPTSNSRIADAEFEELLLRMLNPGDRDLQEALVMLFMLVYSQRPKRLATLRLEDIFVNRQGYRIFFSQEEVHLDPAVADVLVRYLEVRSQHKDENNEYLFPGRLPGSHISPATIKEYPTRFGVTAKELFVTSLMRLSKFKLRHPNALTKSLDMSVATAVKYTSIFNERMQREVKRGL